jgi:hypothetical protein
METAREALVPVVLMLAVLMLVVSTRVALQRVAWTLAALKPAARASPPRDRSLWTPRRRTRPTQRPQTALHSEPWKSISKQRMGL